MQGHQQGQKVEKNQWKNQQYAKIISREDDD